jgi:hypothetical protein
VSFDQMLIPVPAYNGPMGVFEDLGDFDGDEYGDAGMLHLDRDPAFDGDMGIFTDYEGPPQVVIDPNDLDINAMCEAFREKHPDGRMPWINFEAFDIDWLDRSVERKLDELLNRKLKYDPSLAA